MVTRLANWSDLLPMLSSFDYMKVVTDSPHNSVSRPLPGGVIPALPTPLLSNGALDEPGYAALIDRSVEAGVDGVLALGSSGEVAAIDAGVRSHAVTVALTAARGRVPVIIGVAGADIAATRSAIASLADAGASAALVAPPSYGPLTQDGVTRFYESIATDAIPLLGYHIPAFTNVRIEPSTVARLARSGALSGIKDSARDLEYLQQVIHARDRSNHQWAVYVGTDSLLLPAMLLGATGGITLAASIAPAWAVQVIRELRAGRLNEAVAGQAKLTELVLVLRKGDFPAGAKAALSLQGIAGRDLAAPRDGLGEEELRVLERELIALGVPGLVPAQGAA